MTDEKRGGIGGKGRERLNVRGRCGAELWLAHGLDSGYVEGWDEELRRGGQGSWSRCRISPF